MKLKRLTLNNSSNLGPASDGQATRCLLASNGWTFELDERGVTARRQIAKEVLGFWFPLTAVGFGELEAEKAK